MKRGAIIFGTIALGVAAVLWWRLLVVNQPHRSAGAVPQRPNPPTRKVTLDLDKQKYIWDLEHVAFELEAKFAAKFNGALRDRDQAGLLAVFLPDSTGTVLDRSKVERTQKGPLQERRIARTDSDERPAGPDGVVEYLLGHLAEFEQVYGLSFRVLQIDAEDRDPATGEWEMAAYLSGYGRGTHGGPIAFESVHQVACRFQNEDEIAAGRIITRWNVRSEIIRTSSTVFLEEVTAQVGLDRFALYDNWTKEPDRLPAQFGVQVAVEDFDRDGYLDIAIAAFDGRYYLLRSQAGQSFVDVANSSGIQSAPTGDNYLAAWIDFDNDGYPDLLLGNTLYHNVRGTRFENVTASSGLKFGSVPMGCVVADYDCDGLLDLYVLYQVSSAPVSGEQGFVGDDQTGAENHLWHNEGGGRFRNVTEQAGAGGGKRHSFAATWFHANQDRYPDLYIANDFGANVLLLNRGDGRFDDATAAAMVGDYSTSMGVAAGDIDNDGSPDLYVANMYSKTGRRIVAHVSAADYPAEIYEQIVGSCAGSRLYKAASGHAVYDEVSEPFGVNPVGWAFGPAFADLDADGFLDIHATTGFLSFRPDRPDG